MAVFVIIVLLLLFGTPIFIVIAGLALYLFSSSQIDSSAMIIEMYRMATTPILVAIPLFTFAGYLLSESGTPKRLIRLHDAILGWSPGGLAVITLISCSIFTALTGATGLTIIALGGILLPALLRGQYPERFSLGLVTTSGTMGLLLPPRLPRSGYAILLVVLLSGFSVQRAVAAHVPRTRFHGVEVWRAFKESIWEIPLPVIILGGIYSGYFAVSEAAAITAVYVLLIEVGIYRDIKWRELPQIMRKSMVLVGGILIILGAALGLTNYLIDAEIPLKVFQFFKAHITSPIVFLIMLNLFLLAVGCIMDIFAALTVVVPIITPVAIAYGIHPVHLGIIFLANLHIGASTPPVGINLFISSMRFEKPLMRIVQSVLPFILILLIALALITYVPWLSLVFLK